jgi:hypothetical protein
MKMETFDGAGFDGFAPSTLNDAVATAVAILERRRHDRIGLHLHGRYMLEDMSEHECETLDVSPGGLRIKTSVVAPWGARVVAYIEGLGRVEGVVVRRTREWFAIALRLGPSKQQRLASKIDWFAERAHEEGSERRIVPRDDRDNEFIVVRTEEGREYPGELIDMSMEGAAFLVDAPLRVGQSIRLGAKAAEVIRVFTGGVAVRFS